jgi:quercetin dioxygenase-like cupin family protein
MAELVEDPLFDQRYRMSRQGDVLRIEIWTDPGGGVSSEHFHPQIRERFEVFEGEITFTVEGEDRRIGPGEHLVAEPGVRHSFQNTGPEEAHLVSEAQPAMRLQESIEEAAEMARAGKFSPGGTPKLSALPEAADFILRYRDTTVLTSPPPVVQRVLFPPLAWLHRRGRAAGT